MSEFQKIPRIELTEIDEEMAAAEEFEIKMPKLKKMRRSSEWNRLPEEMKIEVIERLPVKSIVVMKSTSKYLYGIIDDYVDTSSSNNNNDPFLLLWYQTQCMGKSGELVSRTPSLYVVNAISGALYSEFKLHTAKDTTCALYAHSCHGLVCFANDTAQQIHLCNPSTRHSLQLPQPLSPPHQATVGLGFLPRSNQYKLVRWFYPSSSINGRINFQDYQTPLCEILTLTDGNHTSSLSWRPIPNSTCFYPLEPHPVCVNGVIYWLIVGPSKVDSLLAFDLESQQSSVIPLPTDCCCSSAPHRNNLKYMHLAELKGCLCVCSPYFIWSLKDPSNQEWVRPYFFRHLARVVASFPTSDPHAEELLSLEFYRSSSLVYYNTGTTKLRRSENLLDFHFNRQPCFFFDSSFSIRDKTILY